VPTEANTGVDQPKQKYAKQAYEKKEFRPKGPLVYRPKNATQDAQASTSSTANRVDEESKVTHPRGGLHKFEDDD
jgi:hypothetical protein